MKKILVLLMSTLALTAAFAQGVQEGPIQRKVVDTTITIYATNDMHGRVDPSVSGP